MPRDYARTSSKKKQRSRRRSGAPSSSRGLKPLYYIVVGIGISYAFQHPALVQRYGSQARFWLQHQWQQHATTVSTKPKQVVATAPQRDIAVHEGQQSQPDLQFYQILKHAKRMVASELQRQAPRYTIQVGAFINTQSCQRLSARLDHRGYDTKIQSFERQDVQYCRVLVGAFETLAQAYEVKNQLYGDGVVGVLRQQPTL